MILYEEEFVMAEKDGLYSKYSDGKSTSYGFTTLRNAHFSSPLYCKKPTDTTYESKDNGNGDFQELEEAALIKVKKLIIKCKE
jgi:hypothetical protein